MWLRRLRGSSGAGSTPVDGQTIRWQSERLARLFAVAIVSLLAMPCTEAITSAVTVALRRHGEKNTRCCWLQSPHRLCQPPTGRISGNGAERHALGCRCWNGS